MGSPHKAAIYRGQKLQDKKKNTTTKQIKNNTRMSVS